MRLITWNCQGAFRKKIDTILTYRPDVIVVQECENLDRLVLKPSTKKPNYQYWYGDNVHKGVGIYSFSNYEFELLPDYKSDFRHILPFRMRGNEQTFTFFAIWAMDNKDNYDARYIGQIWLALNHYTNLLDNKTIIIGDFNSNRIWDYKERVGNHTAVVNKLTDNNIHSIYHKHFNLEQGREKHPTFFLQRNQNKPYHIDYCFLSADLIDKVQNVEIGDYEEWKAHSDHSPLIIDFDL
jgi:exodeoxyribonuclease III